jgi:hypothetical protein
MSERTEQINIRLTPDTKAKWAEFAEESRSVEGMSDLVRRAVNAYVDAHGDPTAVDGLSSGQAAANVPDDLTDRLTRIEDTLDDVATTVTRVDESAEVIERQLLDDNRENFVDRLMAIIPPSKPLSGEWDSDRERYEDDPEGGNIVWEGTASAFAAELDADVTHVEQALEAARENRDDVPLGTEVLDGERRWWSDRDLRYQPYADRRSDEWEAERRKRERRQKERQR